MLIEDVDSTGLALRSAQRSDRDVSVSRSCLLNVLDGGWRSLASAPACLDRPLVRPGRIDRVVKFGSPQKPEILAALERHATAPADAAARAARFEAFYARLRGAQLTMSGIVDFLFRWPQEYLERVGELLAQGSLMREAGDEAAPGVLYG